MRGDHAVRVLESYTMVTLQMTYEEFQAVHAAVMAVRFSAPRDHPDREPLDRAARTFREVEIEVQTKMLQQKHEIQAMAPGTKLPEVGP